MTLKECYEALEGDYEEVVSRLRTEERIRKFVLKFPADGSFALLKASLQEGNGQEAFRAAHTLKGVCQNLGFTRLGRSSSELTENLRREIGPDAGKLLEQMEQDYHQTIAAISAFREQ